MSDNSDTKNKNQQESDNEETQDNDNKNDNENQNENEMKVTVNPTRASTLAQNLSQVQSQIRTALQKHSSHTNAQRNVRLIAVSKLKPASDILSLYQNDGSKGEGHRHFGENYVQELIEKSRLLPRDIKWHFIGGLQSNKCLQLARDVPGLWAVESVDSIKKAKLLNKGRQESQSQDQESGNEKEKLNVYVQVNTSGEDSKSGVEPKSKDLLELAQYIKNDKETPCLELKGLMTIGAIARSREATTAETENEDFVCLRESRDWLVDQLSESSGDKEEEIKLELSMGMSSDFESAITQGSDEVRVGSTIFGERPAKKDAKVVEDVEEEKS